MTLRRTRIAGVGQATKNDLFARLTPHMRELDRFLFSQLKFFAPEIRELVRYCLDGSGKRLRPSLVFFSGWGGPREDTAALVRAAAVVELVHLATLVHDDIMDGADLRRNRPTAGRRFGCDAAVLLGDALLAHAVNLASQFPSARVCRVVSAATRQVCAGEIAQTLRRGDTTVSRADYRRIVGLKTAELFRVSCLLGSSLAGFGRGYVEAVTEFGRRLGIAYQIYDDLADFFGEEKRIGKTLGTDFAGGKMTLPLLVLLRKLPRSGQRKLLDEIRSRRAPQMTPRLAQMNEYGVFDDVARAIDRELAVAVAFVARWPRRESASLLRRLAELLRTQVAALKPEARI